MTNQYHATPYDMSAMGFYFGTYEEYVEKAATHTNENGNPVEEYEIQFIDGDNYKLFEALSINQANLSRIRPVNPTYPSSACSFTPVTAKRALCSLGYGMRELWQASGGVVNGANRSGSR